MSVKKTSAEKRHEQSEVRRMRNKAVKSRCHTAERKFVEAVQKKYKVLQSELDVAYKKGVKKRNAVARKKSRMMKFFHKNFDAQTAAN